MNNEETNYYHAGDFVYCSYYHSELTPYVLTDEYGNYMGETYNCSCEKAFIEQQMNKEISILKKQIDVIKERYSKQLEINIDELNKNIFFAEVEQLKRRYNIK